LWNAAEHSTLYSLACGFLAAFFFVSATHWRTTALCGGNSELVMTPGENGY
jgi:hypothetical protein